MPPAQPPKKYLWKSYQIVELLSYIWKLLAETTLEQPTEEKVISYIFEFTYEESIFFTFGVKYKTSKEIT